jgi:hypothetical protein
MSQIARFGRLFTVVVCIGITTGTIVLSKADAWFYYPAKREPVYIPNSAQPIQNPQIYNPRSRISREKLSKFAYGYYAPGQSTNAMRSTLGAPYASVPRSNVELYPLDHDNQTWIAFQYDQDGRYVGYSISANNQVIAEPTISQVLARGHGAAPQQQAWVQPARAYSAPAPVYQQPSTYVQQRSNLDVCGRFPLARGCGIR